MNTRIGIDVGGTFTDFYVCSSRAGSRTFKVLSTPEDPSIAMLEGLDQAAKAFKQPLAAFLEAVEVIVHGTTVTTNATLTRTGARTALITTAGLRDALEMRRGIREEQYNNRFENVVPLAPRFLRIGVEGRLDRGGNEVHPLDEDQVRDAVSHFRKHDVEAVAICFMHSYRNPVHEQRAAEIVKAEFPEAYLSVSSEVLPTVRFYNRVSTTVVNASVGPVLSRYLGRLSERLKNAGFAGTLLVMQSSGGVASPDATVRRPASTLLSGPAGGPRAAWAFTTEHDGVGCLLVDMGGTSFDASLVRCGAAEVRNESDVDRLRVALPMLDITTIGAGGGSVGWIDEGGLLRMGPRSAGASPGPACYGRGGREPTCTDANLVLGYLDPASFAGGRMRLDAAAARRAVEERIARPLGMSVEQAAAGMYRVINTNMAHGVREITVRRGIDPREFPMVVAGGAAALHACGIALELGLTRLLAPPCASVLCAAGMAMADLEHESARSVVSMLSTLAGGRLSSIARGLAADGHGRLLAEGVPDDRIEHHVVLDMRYARQYHEVGVEFSLAVVEREDQDAITQAFHTEHDRLFGYHMGDGDADIEVITVRVRSLGRTPAPDLPALEMGDKNPEPAGRGVRRGYVPESGQWIDLPVYDGHLLRAGNEIRGPALVERKDTTILVSRDFRARVDRLGSLLMTRDASRDEKDGP